MATHHAAGFECEPVAGACWEEAHGAAFPETHEEGEEVAEDVGEFLEWESGG